MLLKMTSEVSLTSSLGLHQYLAARKPNVTTRTIKVHINDCEPLPAAVAGRRAASRAIFSIPESATDDLPLMKDKDVEGMAAPGTLSASHRMAPVAFVASAALAVDKERSATMKVEGLAAIQPIRRRH